jgi:hypothetical protein
MSNIEQPILNDEVVWQRCSGMAAIKWHGSRP